MTQLLIFPCNGNGIEALDCLGPGIECVGFIDDTPEKQGTTAAGVPVFSRKALQDYPDAVVLAVPGSPTSFPQRDAIIASLELPASRFATVIHPGAHVSSGAAIGYNVLIMAGAVITSNARVGNHVCMLPNSVLHHDSVIGDYTLVGSQVVIAGNTEVGRKCYIGSASSLINGIRIGDHSLVGMGSNVICSLPENSKVVGNPAKLPGQ
ncbi:MAG: NeuD/PglB/VioB family sugar acetyltransferase [Flavobacteriales bacterium]